MGQRVTVPAAGPRPGLAAAVAELCADGIPSSVLMVDGQLVHPAAPVPAAWREVRLRTPAGMVTLTRERDEVSIAVFGNASAELLATRDRLAQALARAAG